MQQDAALQQRKSRLSVGTAFDPLHFIHETLNHSIAPGHAASIGNSLRIVSQRAQQKRLARQSHWSGQRLSIAPSAPAPRVFAADDQNPA